KYVITLNKVDLYQVKRDSAGTRFTVTGNYNGSQYLAYDDHAGYDYRTKDSDQDPLNGRVNVYAAAGGVLSFGTTTYNEVTIDHGNGYRTRYLHLYTRKSELIGKT